MKLSKKQLEDFIVGSVSDCEEYGLSDKQERAALEALRNDTLEIEGYKQMKDVDSIDGKPLTGGEKALIKALRRGRIFQQYVDPRAVVVEALKDGNLKIHHEFVAFCMHSNIDTARVRAAIKKIKAEQEAGNEAE